MYHNLSVFYCYFAFILHREGGLVVRLDGADDGDAFATAHKVAAEGDAGGGGVAPGLCAAVGAAPARAGSIAKIGRHHDAGEVAQRGRERAAGHKVAFIMVNYSCRHGHAVLRKGTFSALSMSVQALKLSSCFIV